jgi:hypothetical protein
MFTSVRSIYSALGVMLFLVALYLVLTNAGGFTQIVGAVSSFSGNTFKVLQGRG